MLTESSKSVHCVNSQSASSCYQPVADTARSEILALQHIQQITTANAYNSALELEITQTQFDAFKPLYLAGQQCPSINIIIR